ncbi:putative sterigmatocystin biosynthesis [Smittium culicis]|uniref:Putative sterigmatocystin biosynthesis n=1 Tax=Smittium culicis TaxID=133412 RepID=A0A1R1X456_9FUNG|nr:putative sterigmatocystin biosynthesis [Smittium culicis]
MDSLIKLAELSYSYILKNYYNKKALYTVLCAYGVFKTIYLAFVDPLRKVPGPWYARFSKIPVRYAQFSGETQRYFQSLHDKYGPIVRAGPRTLSCSSSKEFKQVMSTYRYKKSTIYEGFANVHPNIFSTRDETLNKTRRRQVGPAVSQKGLNVIESLVSSVCIDSAGTKLEQLTQEGSGSAEINYFNFFQNITTDVVGELGFGIKIGAVQNEGHPISGWINATVKNSMRFNSFPLLKKFQRIMPGLSNNETNLKNLCMGQIKQRQELIKNNSLDPNTYDVLQIYVTATNPSTNKPLTNDELLTEIVAVSVVGIHTTSITMTWMMAYLMAYPEVYRKLVQEIRTTFPDRSKKISISEAKEKLPYLVATIHEVLRVVGSHGNNLFRDIPKEGLEIHGFNVPYKSEIGMFLPGANLDSSVWEDPKTFNPDRFLGADGDKLKKEVLAFSTGVRMCPGKDFSMMQLYLVFANIFKDFDFSLPADSKFVPNSKNSHPIPNDITYITRLPANPQADCIVVITKSS